MTDARTIKLLQATADAFPALTITLAAPAVLLDDDTVAAPAGAADTAPLEVWAAELAAVIETHAASVRDLAANAQGWTHHVRVEVLGDPGRPRRYQDFVVVASGLPDEDTAAAEGYEYAEVLVAAVVAAGGRRPRAN